MSGWSACDLAHDDCRARPDTAPVLDLSVSPLPDQSPMYDERLPAHHAMGTRGGPRDDAGAPAPDAAGLAYPTADRRACVRHAQSLDGGDALSDKDVAARQYRDEPARSGLQPETSDADRRHRAVDAGDEGLSAVHRQKPPNNTGLEASLRAPPRRDTDQSDTTPNGNALSRRLPETASRHLRQSPVAIQRFHTASVNCGLGESPLPRVQPRDG